MLKKLFKSKRESELILEKELLEIEIEKLKNEIRKKDGFLKCKNSLFIEKDNEKKQEKNWQEIEEQLKKYLYEARFKELVEILKKKGNKFVQDLNEYVIERLSVEDSLKLELKRKFEKFQKLEINWEIKTQLLKGEKLSKIYSKHRKFINIMTNENKEFISDLDEYKFDILVNKGFSLDEIEELKRIYQDYILKYRIENL